MPPRDPLAPFRMAVIDKFKDLGTVVMGKSESGAVRKGDTLLLMPNKCAGFPLPVGNQKSDKQPNLLGQKRQLPTTG